MLKPHGARFEITDIARGLRIVVHRPPHGAVLAGGVLLLLSLAGLAGGVYALFFQDHSLYRQGPPPPLWFFGWITLSLGFTAEVVSMIGGVETVTTDGIWLEHRVDTFGLRRVKRYRLSLVRNIRAVPHVWFGLSQDRLHWEGGGVVAFDHVTRTFRFGVGLDERDGRVIADRLRAVMPVRSDVTAGPL